MPLPLEEVPRQQALNDLIQRAVAEQLGQPGALEKAVADAVAAQLGGAGKRGFVGAKAKAKCPYGCTGGRLNEHGYCRHLVGFTNATNAKPGDVMELRERVKKETKEKGSDRVSTFIYDRVKTKAEIEPGDIVVPVTYTSRVYRKNGKAPMRVTQAELDKEIEAASWGVEQEEWEQEDAIDAEMEADQPTRPKEALKA